MGYRLAHREDGLVRVERATEQQAEQVASAQRFPLQGLEQLGEMLLVVAFQLADPHVRARGLVSSFDYPGVGEFRALALPYKFLGWDDPAVGRPPALGEHTDAVLKEMLHFSESEIRELRKAKAI